VPPLKQNNGDIYDELEKDIEATSNQVKDLLREVQEGQVHFTELKSHLNMLSSIVNELSSILKDSKGGQSLITRVALIEQKIESTNKSLDKIEKLIEKHISEDKESDDKSNNAKNAGKWQLRAALVTGIFGLIAAIIGLITQFAK